MALEEKISKHLGKPYVYLPKYHKFLCENGVVFTMEEYKNGIDINAEYERREKEDLLYDYIYAKNTGFLRKKRGSVNEAIHQKPVEEVTQEDDSKEEQTQTPEMVEEEQRPNGCDLSSSRNDINASYETTPKAVWLIVTLLGVTSVISMYMSTLHTATYLKDYVDLISAWLMSASITSYNATAFEVSVLFKIKRRYFLSTLFIFLWTLVTLFSMSTTVSVFYDRFNFNEVTQQTETQAFDSAKLQLEMLQKQEESLRESIAFKKKDIEYRQEKDYATATVRLELKKLEEELQANLEEQKKVLSDTPDVVKEEVKRKESLFVFLGRKLKVDGGILEFIFSVLSAIFINLIAPISMTAVTEIVRKERLTK